MQTKSSREVSLNFFNVALMYVGAIMGAGFASGRELWQFMGLFGAKGIIGTVFVAICFVVLGFMTSYIARTKNTNDFSIIITPPGYPKLRKCVSVFMSVMLFSVLITMSAAGGALLHQNYGISRVFGGVIICFFVVITVLGDFERVSHVFKYIMPVLFAIAVITSIVIIFSNFGDLGYHAKSRACCDGTELGTGGTSIYFLQSACHDTDDLKFFNTRKERETRPVGLGTRRTHGRGTRSCNHTCASDRHELCGCERYANALRMHSLFQNRWGSSTPSYFSLRFIPRRRAISTDLRPKSRMARKKAKS